jgi:hypothetical protein
VSYKTFLKGNLRDTDSSIVRDRWDSVKGEFEQTLSDVLGEAWTIDVNPNQLYAYAEEGYAKEQPGAMIAQ